MSVSINSSLARIVTLDELRAAIATSKKLYRVRLVQYSDTWFKHAGVFTIVELPAPADSRVTVNLAGQCFAQHSGTLIEKLYPNHAAIAEDAIWLTEVIKSLTDWIKPAARLDRELLTAYTRTLWANADMVDQLLTTTFAHQVSAEVTRLGSIYLLDKNQMLPSQNDATEVDLTITRVCQIHFGPTDVYQTCAIQSKLLPARTDQTQTASEDKTRTDWILYIPRQSQYRRIHATSAGEKPEYFIFVRSERIPVKFLTAAPTE